MSEPLEVNGLNPPMLPGSFEARDVIEIHNRVRFCFYTGLPHGGSRI